MSADHPEGNHLNWRGKGSLKIPDNAKNVCVISFWNNNPSLYKKFLSGCLMALKNRNKLKGEVFVSIPQIGLKHISNIAEPKSDLSEKEKEYHDLRMKLHTATGVEKSLIRYRLDSLSSGNVEDDKGSFPPPVGSNKSSKKREFRDKMIDVGMSGYLTQSESKRD